MRWPVLLLALVAGCASVPLDEVWVGRSKAEVIDEYGTPDRRSEDGRGGELLEWWGPVRLPWLGFRPFRPVTRLWVGADGIVYEAREDRRY